LASNELGYHSCYTDYTTGWASEESEYHSQHEKEILLFIKVPRLAMISTKFSIQWVPKALSFGGRFVRAWSWPFTSN